MPVIHYRKTRRTALGKYTNVPWITGECIPKSHALNSHSSDTHKKLQTLVAVPDKTIASFFNLSSLFITEQWKERKKDQHHGQLVVTWTNQINALPPLPPYSLSLRLASFVCKKVTSCWKCPQRLLEAWFICKGNHWQHQCLPSQLGFIPFHNDKSGGERASYTGSSHVQTILKSPMNLGLQEA